MDDQLPATAPDGALVPPPRKPPTAVGTSAPVPPSPVPRRPGFPHRHPALRGPALVDALRATVNAVLDVADAMVERLEDSAHSG